MKVKDYSYDTFPDYDLEIEGVIDVEGKKDNLRVRLKDVYYKENCMIRFLFPNTILDEERKYPLIIHVQGSGWYQQDMDDHIFDFMPIVKEGYAYAIIQYRHAPEYQFPTPIIDTKQAIRYIVSHQDAYPIDINHLFLSGDSSGGHVALMTLVTYNTGMFDSLKSTLPPIKGCIDLYGVADILGMSDWYCKYDWMEKSNTVDFMGEDHMSEDDLVAASPISYINQLSSFPPTIILHGSKDHVVPFTVSLNLYNKLKSKGFDTTLVRVKHADHGRSIFYVEDTYQVLIAWLNNLMK